MLLVTVDTLRRDHTSLHGHDSPTTPGLERLADRSVVFETAYAPSSTTAPSHASLLTGLYPPSHGVVKNAVPLEPRQRTLAEILGEHGYQTAAVVSSFVLDAKFGWSQGFDVYIDDFPSETASATPGTWEEHRLEEGFDRRAEATTRLASRWIWERNRDRPFFLFVHYFDPHAPYLPPESFEPRFPLPGRTGDAARDALVVREQRALYDAEIAYTDAALTRLVEVLEAEGLADDTLMLVTADHGEGLLDHGFMSHGTTLYEEVVRVPLLVRGPGIAAPRRIEEPVELVDVAPTLLALLDLPGEAESFQGRSLASALGGAALEAERPVFLARRPYEPVHIEGQPVAGELYGIRVGPWKWIGDPSVAGGELYHVGRDPGEREDLSAEHAERAERMAARLALWRQSQRAGSRSPQRLSEPDRRALEALGYVE